MTEKVFCFFTNIYYIDISVCGGEVCCPQCVPSKKRRKNILFELTKTACGPRHKNEFVIPTLT